MNVINLDTLGQYAGEIHSTEWSVLIPAAGKGSRLGFDKAKILYPVAGKRILDWLLDRFEPLVEEVVLVLSPEHHQEVEEAARERLGNRLKVALQETPTGMGAAVGIGLKAVTKPRVALVWGDQVALRAASVEACLRVHSGPLSPACTCPTVWRSAPYIHFDRNAAGHIEKVRQAREGDLMPAEGESDTGFFCFDRLQLADALERHRDHPSARGAKTGEFNLLPLIGLMSLEGLTVATPQVMRIEETVGINSAADANSLEGVLGN